MATHNREMATMEPPLVDDLSARLHKLQMTTHISEMTAMEPPTVDDLSARLSKIPQELQDEIFEITIAIRTTRETGSGVAISRDWRPPWQMQINKASRSRVAKRYFSDNIFILPSAVNSIVPSLTDTFDEGGPWLAALATDHAAMIENICVTYYHSLSGKCLLLLRSPAIDPHLARRLARAVLAQIEGIQEHLEVVSSHRLREDCVKVDWEVEVEGGEADEENTIGDAGVGSHRDSVKSERRFLSAKQLKAAFEEAGMV